MSVEEFFTTSAKPVLASSEMAGQMADRFRSTGAEDGSAADQAPETAPEAPSIPYDPRPLYEKLAEKKRIAEEGNLVRRLDEDEIAFLNQYTETDHERQRAEANEERAELESFRKAVAEAKPDAATEMLQLGKDPSAIAAPASTTTPVVRKPVVVRDAQRSLLQGAIVRKRKVEGGGGDGPAKKVLVAGGGKSAEADRPVAKGVAVVADAKKSSAASSAPPTGLAGLGDYADSSDEED
ncbi:hypothetical protein BDK51DRAFT_34439 [Blyttiomyces helicus]|uniref:FAM192A/Fyv6 N-terminal domain-containing protein n=1 Tax=Blyttiomyces helicus TaxID=388810 RepID=A0A4P9WAT2_9FUNG|nr:hypothetical protein BDK51DRAFT_34439 [Blyttiomyces helicus]|eukprot:RKO87990.1 hypothetical protein BDK51DRAFT_34439 [Blyttiomyces helicus]